MGKNRFVWGDGDIEIIKTPVGEVVTDFSDVETETEEVDEEPDEVK
jgi:hypothetical protein